MSRDKRCMYMAHCCFMSVVVSVWGSGNVCCVAAVVDFFSLGVLKYVVCLCSGCDVMYGKCVASCRCCMSCVHPVAVVNAAFCMTFRLLMLVEDGDHMEEVYSRAGLIT